MQPNWFDRKFDFSLSMDKYDSIRERLKQAPDILREITRGISEPVLVYKDDGKWSVKENAGHLSVLEPLWRVRFSDIQYNKPELTVADLENRRTTEANFNSSDILELVETFSEERNQTLLLLENVSERDASKSSLHPRLKKPMRIIDLAYFIAEHDAHHIARIREIVRLTGR